MLLGQKMYIFGLFLVILYMLNKYPFEKSGLYRINNSEKT